MKRKFVTNLILLILLNVLIKPFWIFGIDIPIQNAVGAAGYGFYGSLLSFSMILNILLDLGLTNFNNRNIAQHGHMLRKYLSNIVGLKFLLSIFYAIVCLLLAWIVGYDRLQFHILFFLIANQFMISFTLYLRSNISGLQLFRTDSLLSVLDRFLVIIICSVLLFTNVTGGEFRIEWFVYAQTAAYALAMLISFGVVLAKSGRIRIKFDPRFFRVLLRQSYPYALLILLMSFYNRIDSVMIERLLPDGKEQAGIYANAFRLLEAATMFGYLFAGLLLPIFAKMIKQKQDISQMLKLSFLLIIVPAVIIGISSNFYEKEIMTLIYRENIESSSPIFALLMISFVSISITYIFGTLLTANGSLKQLNIMAFAGMVINIGLNLILIPEIKALGSAWSSLVTQGFTALSQVLIAVSVFKLKINYKLLAKLGLFIVFTIVVGKLSLYFTSWLAGYSLMIIASLGFAFATRLINLKTLLGVIANDEA
ncbi:MAG: hypothetical protein A2W90_17565 [Bacteroidetes bacterium GWF2_42_66]|nr:MAG: hypothetical protein A2W92_16780 [Bacteroidetes bacterium GWA2_42_15]OFX98068.1 MAG: hypothetical protein A2W89_09055 [Bacteroidetes bacterium GWE2_42_39]OFY42451.1 MAG: hypothetical protein A2W90_17565 [Bacteroidetes bacterium GWF2_42_66]HBL74161.1 hypothetical protein [Prolixibacteraceae bacterium]HCR91647.1 hypothetical protein [Prolixibacteraceae bacterium]